MTTEPTNAELKDHIDAGFQHDGRVRALEIAQAGQSATMGALVQRFDAAENTRKTDKAELLTAIKDSKTNLWPAVLAIVAIIGVVLTVVYGTPPS